MIFSRFGFLAQLVSFPRKVGVIFSLCFNDFNLVYREETEEIQRRKYQELQTKLFEMWEQYEGGQRSVDRLLEGCLFLNGPTQ